MPLPGFLDSPVSTQPDLPTSAAANTAALLHNPACCAFGVFFFSSAFTSTSLFAYMLTVAVRLRRRSPPRSKNQQWLTATASATGEMAARLFSGLAYARHGALLGFSELIGTVVAYIAAAPLGVDHTALGLKVIEPALRFASRRWVLWTKSPPGAKPPPTFLESGDHCFEMLQGAYKAQGDLFALSSAYPSLVGQLARQSASSGGGPWPRH